MSNFSLRPKARQDLEDIWFYTLNTWGEAQADKYIYDLNDSFEFLKDNPERGRPCDYVREGYRKHYVGKHIVFYRKTSTGVDIVRILHQRMDLEQHL